MPMRSQLQSNGKKGIAGCGLRIADFSKWAGRCCAAALNLGRREFPFFPKLGRRRSTALPNHWKDSFISISKSAIRSPQSAIRLFGAAIFCALITDSPLHAQVNYLETNVVVRTIGGGPPGGANNLCGSPAGFVDGNTLEYSQFDGPVAMALNSQNTLFIADKTNYSVRMVTSVGDTGSSSTITSPVLDGVGNVVGVAVDAADDLYVLTQTPNMLRKYNYSLNQLYASVLPYTPAALAVSADSFTNIFVAFTNGIVLKYAQSGSTLLSSNTIVASGSKLRPGGIAWRTDGVLALSDLANNAIYLLAGTNNSVPDLYAGGGPDGQQPGWVDGTLPYSEFNQPLGLTWSPDGQLIVADSLNNAVRRIDATGVVSTVYGVNSNLWGASDCLEGIFAGWVDGSFGFTNGSATGDAPASVLLAPSGTIYVTELHYDLLREVTGVTFNTGTNAVGGTGTNSTGVTNSLLAPPTISPSFGYFPLCQTINVSSGGSLVYYTTDGTTPTTNSLVVPNMTTVLVNGHTVYEGSFEWCNSTNDLTALKIFTVNGTNTSLITNGISSPTNYIGFAGSQVAGSGSTAVVPIVANLQPNVTLASVQFDLEILPNSGTTPAIDSTTISLLNITTNDYHQLVGAVAPSSPFIQYERLDGGNILGLIEPAG